MLLVDEGSILTSAGAAAGLDLCLHTPRTFLRRFAEETGTTPLQRILRARVDTARERLESTRLSVDRIADQIGLGTGSNLRLQARRLQDVSPSEYRATFSGWS